MQFGLVESHFTYDDENTFFFWRVYKINAKRNRNYSNQVELYHPEFFVTTLQVTQVIYLVYRLF